MPIAIDTATATPPTPSSMKAWQYTSPAALVHALLLIAHPEQQADGEQPEREHDLGPSRPEEHRDKLRPAPRPKGTRSTEATPKPRWRAHSCAPARRWRWSCTCGMTGNRTRLTIRSNAVAGITIKL